MQNMLRLGITGLISGVLSFFVWDKGSALDNFDSLILYSPGLLFGAVLVIFFWVFIFEKKILNIFFSIAWILAAWGSFYLAVQTTIQLFFRLNDFNSASSFLKINQAVPFFVGGIVGGGCVALAFFLFIKRLSVFSIIFVSLLGGILGLAAVYLPFDDANIHTMFIVWQTGIAAALGYMCSPGKEQNTYEALGS